MYRWHDYTVVSANNFFMKQNKQEQATQNQTGAKNNQNGKAGLSANNADMTKGRDGNVNEHSIKSDKKTTKKQGSKK